MAVSALLLLGVLLAFAQTAGHEFVNFDDAEYVRDNPQVAGGLTAPGLRWAFTQVHASNWHPLTWLSHMLDCQLYDLRPGGHHLTSVALHAVVAIVLLLTLVRMTGDLWPSALVAAVFAVHPLRAESVAWVAERKDLLSGLCFALTLAAYAGYARRPFSLGRYLLFLVPFALGLMCKPMLVTLPLVLLLVDFWPLGRWGAVNARRLVLEKIPLVALAIASCAVTVLAQRHAMATGQLVPWGWRIANAVVSYAAYLGQFLCPAGLAAYYPHPIDRLPAWKIAGAAVVLVGISAAALAGRRKCPWLLVGWLWYLIMLVPVIGLVQVGDQAMADRYTYLPLVGPAIALAWGAAHVCRGWRRVPGLAKALAKPVAPSAASAVVLAALTVCAWRQTATWHDSVTLWNRALACGGPSARAYCNLGEALQEQGRNDEAVPHLQRALAINPEYAEALNNLGNALNGQGRLDEAIARYTKALEILPDGAKIHLNLGNALNQKGRFDEAIGHLRTAADAMPDRAEVHYNLANAMLRTGQIAAAIAEYRTALEIRPDWPDARNNFGAALAEAGQVDQAIEQYRRVLAIHPESAEAHNNLGNALNQTGKGDEAITEFQRALAIRPDYAEAHLNFGVALADRGRLDEAMTHYRKVLQVNPGSAEACQNLGGALCRQGKIAEALACWQEGIRRCPNDAPLLNVTAWVLATASDASLRNGALAVSLAQRAVQLSDGRRPEFLDTLAAAYAEAGRFSEALDAARRALRLASEAGNKAMAEALRARIKLYEAGSPLRGTR